MNWRVKTLSLLILESFLINLIYYDSIIDSDDKKKSMKYFTQWRNEFDRKFENRPEFLYEFEHLFSLGELQRIEELKRMHDSDEEPSSSNNPPGDLSKRSKRGKKNH